MFIPEIMSVTEVGRLCLDTVKLLWL
jgi:hypothetical protein